MLTCAISTPRGTPSPQERDLLIRCQYLVYFCVPLFQLDAVLGLDSLNSVSNLHAYTRLPTIDTLQYNRADRDEGTCDALVLVMYPSDCLARIRALVLRSGSYRTVPLFPVSAFSQSFDSSNSNYRAS